MGPVEITMDFAIFSKYIFFDFLLELFLSHKIILPAMDFSLSGSTSGVADGKLKHFGVFLQQKFYKCPLADP